MGHNPIPCVPPPRNTPLVDAHIRLAMRPSVQHYIDLCREQYAEGIFDLRELERRIDVALTEERVVFA